MSPKRRCCCKEGRKNCRTEVAGRRKSKGDYAQVNFKLLLGVLNFPDEVLSM